MRKSIRAELSPLNLLEFSILDGHLKLLGGVRRFKKKGHPMTSQPWFWKVGDVKDPDQFTMTCSSCFSSFCFCSCVPRVPLHRLGMGKNVVSKRKVMAYAKAKSALVCDDEKKMKSSFKETKRRSILAGLRVLKAPAVPWQNGLGRSICFKAPIKNLIIWLPNRLSYLS